MVWIPPQEKQPVVPTKKIWEEVRPGECFIHPNPDLKSIVFRKRSEGEYVLAGKIKIFFDNPLPEIPSATEVEVVVDPVTS
jgi:hypothetical protein